MNDFVNYLIISNKYDFSSDYICSLLNKRNENYLRINRDQFKEYDVDFDINSGILKIIIKGKTFIIEENQLSSIYYRAPTFLRETFLRDSSIEEQLYNSQWMSFIRNLTFFENVKWMNNPVDTYRAENKMLQLKIAQKVGFKIPETKVVNHKNIKKEHEFIIKTIDTSVLKHGNKEAFFYTNLIDSKSLDNYDISLCPIFIQEELKDKIDIRVTVIGQKILPITIKIKDGLIRGDWRKIKNEELEYEIISLPEIVNDRIAKIKDYFNLKFMGLDLILLEDEYYFIEINPTGEWAWLKENTKYSIDEDITEWIIKNEYN